MLEPIAQRSNPNPFERGYRYDAYTVDLAASLIVKTISGCDYGTWKDDPRNVAQAVLDIFLEAGVVVLEIGRAHV